MIMKKFSTIVLGVVLTVGLSACDNRSLPERIHPTYAGPNGECMEWDDEPCDSDPFDSDDDDIHLPKPSKKPSPRPMQTAFQPRPKTTRR